jgi:hypothetical protein
MLAVKWIIIVLALIEGGWMLFDGIRAFAVGDYLTASSDHGQKPCRRWGLEPRSRTVKGLHIALGIA